MNFRSFGKTLKKVSEIGLGLSQFSETRNKNLYGYKSEKQVLSVIKYAISQKINLYESVNSKYESTILSSSTIIAIEASSLPPYMLLLTCVCRLQRMGWLYVRLIDLARILGSEKFSDGFYPGESHPDTSLKFFANTQRYSLTPFTNLNSHYYVQSSYMSVGPV